MCLNVSLSGEIFNTQTKIILARKNGEYLMATTKKNTQVETQATITPTQILDGLKADVEKARASLQVCADKCNEALSTGDLAAVEVAKANGAEIAKTCAKACKDAAFYELAFFSENAILAAIKAKSYMTFRLKTIKDAETDTTEYIVDAREVFISLKEFDTYCTTHGVKGSVDKAWSSEFLALSGAIVAQVVLGFTDAAKREETVKMLKADFDFSKALVKHEAALMNADLADPTSKTQIKKLGQAMVEHLVGNGYVFKDEDYGFLMASVTAYDKRTQKAAVLGSRDLYSLNNMVFQHIVYGTPYEVKTKKA